MDFGYRKLYIDGKLCDAADGARRAVVCPGTGEAVGEIAWAGRRRTRTARSNPPGRASPPSRACRSRSAPRGCTACGKRSSSAGRGPARRGHVMRWARPGKARRKTTKPWSTRSTGYAQEITARASRILPDPDGTHTHQIVSQPLGVAAAFLAWNFPLLNVGFKLGPALAADAHHPAAVLLLAALGLRAGRDLRGGGLPARASINILCGPSGHGGRDHFCAARFRAW